MTEREVFERMKKYVFYHTIQLTDHLRTEGWPIIRPTVDMTVRNLRMLDLRGKRVLDVGCRDGLFCFEAEKLGAAEVVGIDNDLSAAAQEFLIPFLGSKVRMYELNLFDLRPETYGKFDVVVFPGVLYHLRYPIWALKLLRDVLKDDGVLVLETAILADDDRLPLLYCPVGGESPYEPSSCTFFNVKALKDTLHSIGLTVRRVERLVNSHRALEGPAAVKARLRLALQSAPAREQPPVDRATLICDMTPEIIDPQVAFYWDGATICPPGTSRPPQWTSGYKP